MIYYLIQTNFINISILIFLTVFIITNTTLDKYLTRLFYISIVSLFFLMIADSLDFYYASFSTSTILRYFTSAIGYSIRPLIIVFVFLMVSSTYQKGKIILAIPIILNTIICLSSIQNHCVFYFDEMNQFHRGPLGFTPFLTSGYALIILCYTTMQKYKTQWKRESILLLLIIIMSTTATAVETLFKFRFILSGIGALSVVFYYLFLHTQTFKCDALTGIYNRHTFYSDAEKLKRQNIIIVSVDLNNLKNLNDISGHSAGDDAIKKISSIINDNILVNCRFYRVGGDEFIILCPKYDKSIIEEMMHKIIFYINETNYRISYGISSFNANKDFEKACSEADKLMYENKIEQKESK